MVKNMLAHMVAVNEQRLRVEYEKKMNEMKARFDYRLMEAFMFCRQWYFDQSCIAAAEEFGLDPDGVKRFADCLRDNTEEFTELWNADTDDCEYTMVKQDERLKEVCGDYFVPYEERYAGTIAEFRGRWLSE